MKIVGIINVARSGVAAAVRSAGASVADAACLLADLIDPAMPETIWRPREWMPRLWSRTGGRAPAEDRS